MKYVTINNRKGDAFYDEIHWTDFARKCNVSKTKEGLGEQDFSSFLANFFKYTITIMTLRVQLFLPYPLPKTISIKSLPTSIYLINYTINHIIT